MRVHECTVPTCHEVIPINQRWCDAHFKEHQAAVKARQHSQERRQLQSIMAKDYDASKRDAAGIEFYRSKAWHDVRNFVYGRDLATCQVCHNVVQNRKIVDHIVARRLCDYEQAVSPDNLWVLCYRCHAIKTELEQSISLQANGDTKLQHLDRSWWYKVIKRRVK